jgi:hypothetical protein
MSMVVEDVNQRRLFWHGLDDVSPNACTGGVTTIARLALRSRPRFLEQPRVAALAIRCNGQMKVAAQHSPASSRMAEGWDYQQHGVERGAHPSRAADHGNYRKEPNERKGLV